MTVTAHSAKDDATAADIKLVCNWLETLTRHGNQAGSDSDEGIALALAIRRLRRKTAIVDAAQRQNERLLAAISWIEPPFVDENTPEAELRQRIKFVLEDTRRTPSAGIEVRQIGGDGP